MHRRLILSLFLTGLVAAASAQQQGTLEPRTPAAKAKTMVGKAAVVAGTVMEVHKTEKVIHINLGGKNPKQDFTAVVFAPNFKLFPDAEKLDGKRVEVTGKVEDYRGKPQIVVKAKSQLHVLDEAPVAPLTK